MYPLSDSPSSSLGAYPLNLPDSRAYRAIPSLDVIDEDLDEDGESYRVTFSDGYDSENTTYSSALVSDIKSI